MRKLALKKANGLIKVIPSGVVICDSRLGIIECNENFARLMGEEILSMFQIKPGLEENLSVFCVFYRKGRERLWSYPGCDRSSDTKRSCDTRD
jgi:PAS domain-containing protein